jgi:hypothetical protein
MLRGLFCFVKGKRPTGVAGCSTQYVCVARVARARGGKKKRRNYEGKEKSK